MKCGVVISLFVICVVTLFAYSRDFNDMDVVPQKLITLLCLSPLLAISAIRILRPTYSFAHPISFTLLFGIITILCTALAFYGLLQFTGICKSISGFRVSGNFMNPAGFAACLVAGFPAGLYFWNKGNIFFSKPIVIIFESIILAAIIASFSRSAIISLTVVFSLIVFKFFRVRKRLMIICISAGILISAGGLYLLKKDSADGRLLIWNCSFNMIKDKPLFGFGNNGFQKNYMNYQASFFEENPESRFVKVADNTTNPFNEYIGILVNYGIIGFVVFLFFIRLVLRFYFKYPSKESDIAILSLTGIAVFSFFSYPFYYPFVWVISFLSTIIICRCHQPICTISFGARMSICIVLLGVSAYLPYYCIRKINAEVSWKKLMVGWTFSESHSEILVFYESLMPELANNHYFMYNYSVGLYMDEQYEKSLYIANECNKLIADYYLGLIIVENQKKLKKYDEAIHQCQLLNAMCPNRFKPLSHLLDVYIIRNQSAEALKTACDIINKGIKIPSPEINLIIYKANKYLDQYRLE